MTCGVFEKALHREAASFALSIASELDKAADSLVMDTREDLFTSEELLNRIEQSLEELRRGILGRAESELSRLKNEFLP